MVVGSHSVAAHPPPGSPAACILYNLLCRAGGRRLQVVMCLTVHATQDRPAVSTTVLTCPQPNLLLVISITPTGGRANFLDGCRSTHKGIKSQLHAAWHMQAGGREYH